jgi:hypothetical protein
LISDNTHKFISQMKLDLHQTVSACKDWSPELINYVCGCVCDRMHTQCMKMCMQLGAVNKPSFIS